MSSKKYFLSKTREVISTKEELKHFAPL